ncbi:MAG: hypothetical protein ACU84Q_00615 [Gammaproteobacteria bacterium]
MIHLFARSNWRFALASLLLGTLIPGCVVVPPDTSTRSSRAPVTAADDVELPAQASVKLPGVAGNESVSREMTASLLQSELLAFADRYLEAIAEAADWSASEAPDPKARAAFRQTKVIYITAAITTATEPDPLRVLRDMIVMLRLQRLVWENAEIKYASAAARARMTNALSVLEAQLFELAKRVFPADAIDIIYQLTGQWYAANTDRKYVAFVRFHDLGDSGLRQRFDQHMEKGGLLAPVAEATREIQEMRRVAERGVFLANHMPMLVEWQAESLLYHALGLPETQNFLADFDRFANIGERLEQQFERLPTEFAAQRQASLEQLAKLLNDSSSNALSELTRVLRSEREAAMHDLEHSAGAMLPLAEQLATAATGLRDTMAFVAALKGDDSEPSEFSFEQLDETISGIIQLTGETDTLLKSLEALLVSEPAAQSVSQLDEILRGHEQRIFLYLSLLVVLVGAVICGTILIWRRANPGR